MGCSASDFLSTEFEKNVDNVFAFLFLGDGCSFLLAQKGTKDALGAAFGEHLRAAGAHRRLAPKPPFYGGRLSLHQAISSGGQNQVGLSFLPRGHWPLPGLKFERVCVVQTPPA